MEFKKSENKFTGHFYVKSPDLELTVDDDGVYIEGINPEDKDDHACKLSTYQDLQDFAKALGDAWEELERRQAQKRLVKSGTGEGLVTVDGRPLGKPPEETL